MAGINLSMLKQRVTKTAEQGNIVAVVATANMAVEALKAHGLEVQEVIKAADGEQGDIHVIQKGVMEDENADLHMVKISPQLTVVCKGFRPYSDSFEETATFSEIIKARTLRLWDFGEILAEMLHQALYNADDKNAAVSNGVAILEDAKQYVSELFGALPEAVFKMAKDSESLVEKAAEETAADPEVKEEPKGEGEQNVETKKSTDTGTDPASDTPASGGGEVPVGEGENENSGAQGEGQEVKPVEGEEPAPAADPEPAADPAPATDPEPNPGEGEPVTKADESQVAAQVDTAALADTITKSIMAALEPRLQEVEGQVQSIAKTATETATQVDEKLSTTIVSSVTKSAAVPAADDDVDNSGTGIGVIDTAYFDPRSRK